MAWSEEEAWREGKEKIEGSREEREPLNPIVPPGRSNEGPWPKPSPLSNVPVASTLTLEALRQMTGKASPTLPPQYSSAPSTSSSSPTNAKRVFLYMDDESAVKVERVLSSLPDFAANATFTRDFDSAQIIIATQKKIRSNPKMKSLLTRLQIPIVGLKSSSTASIIRDLCSPLGLDPLLSSEVIVSPEASMDEEGQPQSYDARGSRPLGGQGRAAVSSSDDFADLLEQTVRELKGSPVDREFAQNCLRSFLEELPSGGCQASSLASMAWALSHCKHKKKLLESSREDLIALMNQCEGRWGELTPAHLLRIACGLSNLRLCPPSRKWFEEIEIRVKAGISAGSYKVEEEERVSAAIYTLDALLNIEEAQLESTEGITSMS